MAAALDLRRTLHPGTQTKGLHPLDPAPEESKLTAEQFVPILPDL